MTNAALADLRARIASNTLTGPQIAALTTALDNGIVATFPSPDELSGGIPPTEESLAREWFAALYTINGEATGMSAVQEANWYVNPSTGADTNDGLTPATALKTFAALGALWKGTAGGGRPLLDPSTGSTVTVHVLASAAATDPLAPLLDVDLGPNVALIFLGEATSAHSGTIATANAWARTVANGQVRITDAGVADFSVFAGVESLLIHTSTGAVAWLYGPDGAPSATGTCTVGYSAQTAGGFPSIVQTAINAGNSYTLNSLPSVTMGDGWQTRTFPKFGDNSSQVFFYRLSLNQGTSLNPQCNFEGLNVGFNLQECFYALRLNVLSGAVLVANCLGWHTLGLACAGSGVAELLAGGINGQVGGNVGVSLGGTCFVDQDFALISNTAYQVGDGTLLGGDHSSWTATGAALSVSGGRYVHEEIFGFEDIFYGTDGGNPIEVQSGPNAGAVSYSSSTTAAAQFVFTHGTFSLGGQAASFGFDESAGTFVGPTDDTFAHLDAVLGAGTGFGGAAVDPRSGCTFRALA